MWVFLEILQNHLLLAGVAPRFFKYRAAGVFLAHIDLVLAADLGDQQAQSDPSVGNAFSLGLGIVIHAFVGSRMLMVMVMVMIVVMVMVMCGGVRVHRPRHAVIFLLEKAWWHVKVKAVCQRIKDVFLDHLPQCGLMLTIDLLGNRIFQAIQVFKAKTDGQIIINASITFFS